MRAFVAALALVILCGQAAASVVNDGSFEGTGWGAAGGWLAGPGGVSLADQGHGATDGSRAAHLHGGRNGWLNQTVSGLTIGGRYEFAFDFRGGADGLSKVVFAMLLTPEISYHMAAVEGTGSQSRGAGWTRFLFYFDAATTDLTLSFYTPYQGEDGVKLDNVRLGVAPLPAALPMLAAGVVALAMLRRRRRA